MGAASDIEDILKDTVRESIKGHNEMIELLISLNDPSCSHSYEAAKKCGFVFCGLIPGSETADYIVMQMLMGEDYRYDKLVTVGEYEELKNEIVKLIS